MECWTRAELAVLGLRGSLKEARPDLIVHWLRGGGKSKNIPTLFPGILMSFPGVSKGRKKGVQNGHWGKSFISGTWSWKCPFDTQKEMSGKQLDIQVWLSIGRPRLQSVDSTDWVKVPNQYQDLIIHPISIY